MTTNDKPCTVCHAPMPRRTRPSGRQESPTEYAKRNTCSTTCGHKLAGQTNTPAGFKHPPCNHCGGPVTRRPGEKRQRWRTRKSCSTECLTARQSANAIKSNTARHNAPRPHAPCTECGADVPRKPHEKSHAWHSRHTCSEACRRERIRAAALKQERRAPSPRAVTRKVRPARARPERRVAERPAAAPRAFTGFPTPDGLRSKWETVTGPDVGPPEGYHQARGVNRLRSPTALQALATAVRVHPDLSTALAGHLTDSWAAYANGNPTAMRGEWT